MKKLVLHTTSATAISLALLMTACGGGSDSPKTASGVPEKLPSPYEVPIEIAHSPGYEAFIANCQTCHTARYAIMQPDLSRKAWEKTVDKMIKVYGAEIDSTTAVTIVDYLVARQQ